jgi:hypothetical protein
VAIRSPGGNTERRERIGGLLGAAMNVAVGATMQRAFDRARDDLGAGVHRDRMLDDRRDEQRAVLHQS